MRLHPIRKSFIPVTGEHDISETQIVRRNYRSPQSTLCNGCSFSVSFLWLTVSVQSIHPRSLIRGDTSPPFPPRSHSKLQLLIVLHNVAFFLCFFFVPFQVNLSLFPLFLKRVLAFFSFLNCFLSSLVQIISASSPPVWQLCVYVAYLTPINSFFCTSDIKIPFGTSLGQNRGGGHRHTTNSHRFFFF